MFLEAHQAIDSPQHKRAVERLSFCSEGDEVVSVLEIARHAYESNGLKVIELEETKALLYRLSMVSPVLVTLERDEEGEICGARLLDAVRDELRRHVSVPQESKDGDALVSTETVKSELMRAFGGTQVRATQQQRAVTEMFNQSPGSARWSTPRAVRQRTRAQAINILNGNAVEKWKEEIKAARSGK